MSFRHVANPLAPRLRVLKPISPSSKPWHRTSFSGALNRHTDPTPEEIQAENEHRQRIAELQKRDQQYLTLLTANIDTLLASTDKALKVAKDLRPDNTDDLEQRSGKCSDALRNVRLHVRDQMVDPYPDQSRSSLHDYAETMLTWSEERKRTELKNLVFEAEADGGRLKVFVDGLVKLVREHRDERIERPRYGGNGAGERRGKGRPAANETQDRRASSVPGQSDRAGDRETAKRGRDERDADGKAEKKDVTVDIRAMQATVDATLMGGKKAP